MGQGLLIHKVSRSHTTHHIRYKSSGRMISSSQRPLPDSTQPSQETSIHVSDGIRTHNLSRRAAENLRLRPRGHWDRHIDIIMLCCYGELWLPLVEILCLSEPGFHDYLEGNMRKYGSIARVWIGSYLIVGLAEAKYVEVSKVALVL